VNLTLIDFGAGGKKGTSRGDAALSLLLFESDSYDTVSRGGNLLPEKLYKGGSRGAFEAMAKLREGSVIALLNPRVLKPLQVASFVFFSRAAKLSILSLPGSVYGTETWRTQRTCSHARKRELGGRHWHGDRPGDVQRCEARRQALRQLV